MTRCPSRVIRGLGLVGGLDCRGGLLVSFRGCFDMDFIVRMAVMGDLMAL